MGAFLALSLSLSHVCFSHMLWVTLLSMEPIKSMSLSTINTNCFYVCHAANYVINNEIIHVHNWFYHPFITHIYTLYMFNIIDVRMLNSKNHDSYWLILKSFLNLIEWIGLEMLINRCMHSIYYTMPQATKRHNYLNACISQWHMSTNKIIIVVALSWD